MLLNNFHDTRNAWNLAVGVVEKRKVPFPHGLHVFFSCDLVRMFLE